MASKRKAPPLSDNPTKLGRQEPHACHLSKSTTCSKALFLSVPNNKKSLVVAPPPNIAEEDENLGTRFPLDNHDDEDNKPWECLKPWDSTSDKESTSNKDSTSDNPDDGGDADINQVTTSTEPVSTIVTATTTTG
jgi:hypothetical protein